MNRELFESTAAILITALAGYVLIIMLFTGGNG